MKDRNIVIDLLKFFGVLLITNSHMDVLYEDYSFIATGGAIGNSLFFFCSGFTLFFGKNRSFPNWYKRRITRIIPAVFIWSIFCSIFLGSDMFISLFGGTGWFINCILFLYIIMFFIRKYLPNRIPEIMLMVSLFTIIWYSIMDKPDNFNIYKISHYNWNTVHFCWSFYFLPMLLGAKMGKDMIEGREFKHASIIKDGFLLLFYIVIFYVSQFVARMADNQMFQLVSIAPLLGVTFQFYKVCHLKALKKINTYCNKMIYVIGALSLEIYIVQFRIIQLFTNSGLCIIINIIYCLVLIILSSYILRTLEKFLLQTFYKEDYNCKDIFKI